jgi:hypothetical protein
MRVNNRAFAFKLKLNKSLEDVSIGQNVLFIWGIGNEMVIKGVKALEEQTGLKAVALMTNGGGHHLFLKHWYDNFPSMRIWVCPTKVPMTVNGQRLQKEYASRWELVDNTTVPHHAYQLLDYFGVGDNMQVDCVVFNQFMSYDDKTSGEAGSCQWIEGHKPKENVTTREFMKSMGTLQADMSCRTDDIMFFHKPTSLLITGHHYEFAYLPKGYKMPEDLKFTGSFFFRNILPGIFFKSGRYDTSLGLHQKRIADFKIHAEQWKEVMKWDFEHACSHHDPPTVCGPDTNYTIMNSEGGVRGHMKRMLEKSGELTGEPNYGFFFGFHANKVGKVAKKEAGYAKKWGKLPELHQGGPGFDACGCHADADAEEAIAQ